MTTTEKMKQLDEGIRVMMCLTESDAELRKLLTKVKKLSHAFDADGHLFVGSGVDAGKKGHELRQSKTGNDYCKCPNFAFKQRPGKADSLCKHLVYAYALELEIPRTEDL
jgi:hypothetical protein